MHDMTSRDQMYGHTVMSSHCLVMVVCMSVAPCFSAHEVQSLPPRCRPLADHPIASTHPALVDRMYTYLSASLADTTKQSYGTGLRSYLSFCDMHGYANAWPATWKTVCLWMTWLGDRVQPNTVRAYLSALDTAHEMAGEVPPVRGQDIPPLLERVYRGIKRTRGMMAKTIRRPITTALLRQMYPYMQHHMSDHASIWAAMCCGTYGLLRMGEFTAGNNRAKCLRICDLTFTDAQGITVAAHSLLPSFVPSHASLFIGASKMDPFRKGVNVLLASPVVLAALMSHLTLHEHKHIPSSPLFLMSDGHALTRDTAVAATRRLIECIGLTPGEYAGHSYRKGGAQSLIDAGTPIHLLKTMGRWESECYRLYLTMPIRSIVDAARVM